MAYRLLDPLHRNRSFRILESRTELRLIEGVVRDTIVGGPKDLTRHLGDKQAEKDTEEVVKGALRNPITGGWAAAKKQVSGDTPESRSHDRRAAKDPVSTAVKDAKATLGNDYYKSDYVDPEDKTPQRTPLKGKKKELYQQGKAAYGKGQEAYGKAKSAYDQGKQELHKAKGAFSKVRGLSKPATGAAPAPQKKGKFDIVPDALAFKKSDSWLKTGMKAGVRAPFDGFVATKDLLVGGNAESGLGKVLGWDEKSSFLSRAQDVVDVIGIIDPTGIADGANALAYAAQGKWGDAATSALGMIPYAGDTAKIAKYGARASKVAKATKAAGKVAKVEGRMAKAARLVKKGAQVAGRVSDAAEKIQARKDARELTGEPVQPEGQPQAEQPPERSPLVTPTPEAPTAPQGAPAPNADLGRRGTGPASAPSPAPSMAPPDPGPLAKAREAEQRSPGGASRGERGATEVPVDSDCPGEKTKTSTFRATPGMKRCAKQTPGRDHGDD